LKFSLSWRGTATYFVEKKSEVDFVLGM